MGAKDVDGSLSPNDDGSGGGGVKISAGFTGWSFVFAFDVFIGTKPPISMRGGEGRVFSGARFRSFSESSEETEKAARKGGKVVVDRKLRGFPGRDVGTKDPTVGAGDARPRGSWNDVKVVGLGEVEIEGELNL